jgi:uncharacterized CHY-type Zn-finger protein
MKLIHGCEVYGQMVDCETRCRHYHSELDIVAIKFFCCGRWYPCWECHREAETHITEQWTVESFNEQAILCGSCGERLTVTEYLGCSSQCPQCRTSFNPACANHYHLYFETEATEQSRQAQIR